MLAYDRRITLRALAAMTRERGTYIPFQRLSDIATGRWLPRPEQLRVLCDVLGCKLSDLYPDPAISERLTAA